VRLIAFTLFVIWRISHRNPDALWLWVTSNAGDFWFGFSWLLDQLPKLNPITRVPDLVVLRQWFDRADGTEPRGPESYFELKSHPYMGRAQEDLVNNRRRVRTSTTSSRRGSTGWSQGRIQERKIGELRADATNNYIISILIIEQHHSSK